MAKLPPTKQKLKPKLLLQKKAVVLLAMLLVGVVGVWWLTVHNMPKTPQAQTQTVQTPKNTQKSTPNTAEQTQPAQPYDPTEGGKYFIIKEWGVRFPVPEGYEGDIKYRITYQNESLPDGVAYFTSLRLVNAPAQKNTCDVDPANNLLGVAAISRNGNKTERGEYIKAGDYWYQLELANGGYCHDGQNPESETALRIALSTAFKQIAPSPVQ